MMDYILNLDNWGCSCNMLLVGLAKDTEGPDPVTFMEKWILDYLKISESGQIKLDQAHRVAGPKPSSTQQPRPTIIKFHYFADKQQIMNSERSIGMESAQASTSGPRISFFHDYSATLWKKCRAFQELKEWLKKMNLNCALIYPATLRITVNGIVKRFDNPSGAAAFLDAKNMFHEVNVSLFFMFLYTIGLLVRNYFSVLLVLI